LIYKIWYGLSFYIMTRVGFYYIYIYYCMYIYIWETLLVQCLKFSLFLSFSVSEYRICYAFLPGNGDAHLSFQNGNFKISHRVVTLPTVARSKSFHIIILSLFLCNVKLYTVPMSSSALFLYFLSYFETLHKKNQLFDQTLYKRNETKRRNDIS
jgi:hypothetical protein